MSFQDKVVVITGGANGIGKCMVLRALGLSPERISWWMAE